MADLEKVIDVEVTDQLIRLTLGSAMRLNSTSSGVSPDIEYEMYARQLRALNATPEYEHCNLIEDFACDLVCAYERHVGHQSEDYAEDIEAFLLIALVEFGFTSPNEVDEAFVKAVVQKRINKSQHRFGEGVRVDMLRVNAFERATGKAIFECREVWQAFLAECSQSELVETVRIGFLEGLFAKLGIPCVVKQVSKKQKQQAAQREAHSIGRKVATDLGRFIDGTEFSDEYMSRLEAERLKNVLNEKGYNVERLSGRFLLDVNNGGGVTTDPDVVSYFQALHPHSPPVMIRASEINDSQEVLRNILGQQGVLVDSDRSLVDQLREFVLRNAVCLVIINDEDTVDGHLMNGFAPCLRSIRDQTLYIRPYSGLKVLVLAEEDFPVSYELYRMFGSGDIVPREH